MLSLEHAKMTRSNEKLWSSLIEAALYANGTQSYMYDLILPEIIWTFIEREAMC